MPPTYAFDDVGGTYQAGKSISATEEQARTAGNAFITALGQVSTGDPTVDGAVEQCQVDARGPVERMARDVKNLGEHTAQGAVVAQQTQSEVTTLQNGASSLSRNVNAQARELIAS